ncbi:MAG: glycosyltransferase, partial [Candidatus Eremiobacteraeota bacterium]|nr:glycosyltransferase [Candidatus Eremiobacteraeota bacterium]
MKTAIGIPVFNEEATLGDLLEFLHGEASASEIVAVDDCSTDGSFEFLRAFERRTTTLHAYRAPERSGQLAAWR